MLTQNPESVIRRAIYWTVGAFFLALAVQAGGGRYSPLAMLVLTLAIAAALAGVFFPVLPEWVPATQRSLNFVLGGCSCVFAAFWITSDSALQFVLKVLFCAVFALVLTRLVTGGLIQRLLFPVLALLVLGYGASVIINARNVEQTSPQLVFHVRNDVQTFAVEADRALSEGRNPYSIHMPNVMGADMPFYSDGTTTWKNGDPKTRRGTLTFGYPYLPLSALWSLPAYWLGDFRLSHLLALVIAACLLAYARPSTTSQLAATFFLLFPPALFILLMSWIEPVAIMCLAATVFCYYRAPRWLFLALGCLVASKQYTFFMLALLPLLIPEKEQWRPLLWKSVAVALVLTLPMALWDVAGFYRSVVEIQFKQPFRADSLSYLVVVLHAVGRKISPAFAFLALLGGLWLGVKKAPISVAGWCSAGAVAYLGFFALNKQAFGNYYFWPFSLLIAAVAIALPPKGSEVAGEAGKLVRPAS